MRLAIIAPLVTPIREPQRGGSQAFICDLARGLIDRGAEVAVYAASGSELPGVPVVDVGVDSATLSASSTGPPAAALPIRPRRRAPLRPSIRRCERTGMTSSTTTPSTRRRSASPPGWRPPSSTRSTYRPARRSPPRSAVPQPRLAADGGDCVRLPGNRLARGRPGRRDPSAVRADRSHPVVVGGSDRRPVRRQAEPREGGGGGHRHRPGGRSPDRPLRRQLRRRLRPRPDRPTA